LQKIIAEAGIASRRHAEELILEGVVSVNGAVVTTLGTKADPTRDHIKIDGKRIVPQARSIYLLLNKPKGYITSVKDPQGRPTVMDLISGITDRVYPVGRLDYASEGLLLLTNDGEMAQKLMHPRHEIEKRYWVKVSGHLTEAKLQKVSLGGISTPTGRTAPCQVQRLSQTEEYSWLEVTLHEGKNREIRRVMEKIGHPVNKLKRVGYAFLRVGDMSPGAFRHLTSEEVARLRKYVEKREGGSAIQPVRTPDVQSPEERPERPPDRRPFSPREGQRTDGARNAYKFGSATRPVRTPGVQSREEKPRRPSDRRPFNPREGKRTDGAPHKFGSATRPVRAPGVQSREEKPRRPSDRRPVNPRERKRTDGTRNAHK
jgi:23S rRNA pseudouridine2605 synthase